MENLFEKIPKVGEQILRQLDNQSLVRSKDVNGSWYKFINSEKVLWLRIIQRCVGSGNDFLEAWKKVLTKSPVDFLIQLSIAVLQLHVEDPEIQFSPIHVAICNGSLEFYNQVHARLHCVSSADYQLKVETFKLSTVGI